MSEEKGKSMDTKTSETADFTSIPTSGAKMTKKQKLAAELVRQLTDNATQLVLKVAICKCNHKDNCEVFTKARDIAEIINKLQDIREKVS